MAGTSLSGLGPAIIATASLGGLAAGIGVIALLDRLASPRAVWIRTGNNSLSHAGSSRSAASEVSSAESCQSLLSFVSVRMGHLIDVLSIRSPLQGLLLSAGVPVPLERWMFAVVALSLTALLGGVALGAGWWVLVMLPLIPALAIAQVRMRASRRTSQMHVQMPFYFESLATSVGAGRSLRQALEASSAEASEPLASHVRAMATELALGAPVGVALSSFAASVGAPEFLPVIHGLSVQHLLGGDEKKMLLSAARLLRQEAALRESLHAKTAQARMSVRLVSLAPVAVLVLMAVTMPDYLDVFWETAQGRLIFATAVALDVLGVLAVRNILKAGLR